MNYPPRHRRGPPRDNKPRPTQSCFAGVSGTLFTAILICTHVVMYFMEGPFVYLDIISTLYVLIIAAFTFQILLDLGLWVWTESASPASRLFLSRLCPILCVGLSIPPAGLLWYIEKNGGFMSKTADISLVFSIMIVILELLHLVVTLYAFRNYRQIYDEDSVLFSYSRNPSFSHQSPTPSIRSGRIDFLNNRSMNSLASIQPSFASGFGNMQAQRQSVMDMNSHFWEENMSRQPHRYPDEGTPRRKSRRERRGSDSSVVSSSSYASKRSHQSVSSRKSSRSVSSRKSSRSVTSRFSSRSSSHPPNTNQFRVEEELEYHPAFFQPSMY